MYLQFDFPYRVGINVQQTVYYSQLLFSLRALPDGNPPAILSHGLCRNHDLRLRNTYDLLPSDIRILLQFQAVLGDGYYPVGQHGQIEVSLDGAYSPFRAFSS